MAQPHDKMWSMSFIFVVVSNALVFMIFEMLLPTLPLFVTALGGGASQVGLVTGIFMLSAIIVRPFTAQLVRKFDKKALLVTGIVIMALSTGAYYFSNHIATLLVIRLFHGAGFGLATTYFATLAAEVIPNNRRGEGIGYFGVGETIAISIGPMFGIITLDLYGFQRLFFGGMAVLFLAVVMAGLLKRAPRGEELDKQVVTKFKIMEKRVLFPSLLTFFIGIAAGGMMSFFSLYAIEKEFAHVGLFFLLIAGASFLIRLGSGKMFDRHGPSVIIIPGSIISIAGLIMLYAAVNDSMFFLAALLYGMGFGAIFPALQTWCMNAVGEHEHEDAMASFFNSFDLGIGGGSLILGIIAAATTYQTVYMVAAIVFTSCLVFYIGQLWTKKKSYKRSSNFVSE